jgi:uncharacterized RDD family membrane protein YckC
VFGGLANGKKGDTSALDTAMVIVVVGWGVGFTVFQWYRLVTSGQTLGKKWMDVRVVTVYGGPLTVRSVVVMRGIVPFVLGFVPAVGGIFALADALFVFRDDRRCIHDFMAGTEVIELLG